MTVDIFTKKKRLKSLGFLLILIIIILPIGFNASTSISQGVNNDITSSFQNSSDSDTANLKPARNSAEPNLSDNKEVETIDNFDTVSKNSTVSSECKIAGCSNELCIGTEDEVYNKCNSSRANICLETANCEVQVETGECGWTYDIQSNVCLDGYNTVQKELRVIELRYFPLGEGAAPYHPDDLSVDLQEYLAEASKYHGYDVPYETSAINVNVVDVININTARPDPGGGWQGSYAQMLEDNSLCDRISSEDIDQIWLWVDAVNDTAEGQEYAISSDYFRVNTQAGVKLGFPFCDGENSFVIMGFDYTRTASLALHSFGHYMEGLVRSLDGTDLFWNKYTDISTGVKNCGNVHFPPNAIADYQYSNTNYVTTNCEDWYPDGSGSTEVINCTKWGCTEGGYLVWWMQNFPNQRKLLQYNEDYISNWWNYVVDMDEAIEEIYADNKYHLDRTFVDDNVNLVEACSCSGTDQFGDPVSTNECGFNVTGEDFQCYQCLYSGWQVISTGTCE